jgi:hypothetical protein
MDLSATRRTLQSVCKNNLSAGRRHQSSFQRLTRRLAMPEAPSMKTLKSDGPKTSHIVFNPPPSAPNVYHTPVKFLPEDDIRRRLLETGPSMYNLADQTASFSSSSPSPPGQPRSPIAGTGTALHELAHGFPSGLAPRAPADAPLPPPVSPAYAPAAALTQAQVDEVRRLRREDPDAWPLRRLAHEFGCSYRLVAAIQISPEAHGRHVAENQRTKERWSERRAKARVDRGRRRELWLRDA